MIVHILMSKTKRKQEENLFHFLFLFFQILGICIKEIYLYYLGF
jgi:hypothetical protein